MTALSCSTGGRTVLRGRQNQDRLLRSQDHDQAGRFGQGQAGSQRPIHGRTVTAPIFRRKISSSSAATNDARHWRPGICPPRH